MEQRGDDRHEAGSDLDRLNGNIKKIEVLSARLIAALQKRELHEPGLHAPNPKLYARAYAAMLAEMMTESGQDDRASGGLLGQVPEALRRGAAGPVVGRVARARRPTPPTSVLASPLWQTHPYFNFIKQQYHAVGAGDRGRRCAILTG
jgi:polyhydroxyalkanoate synthase